MPPPLLYGIVVMSKFCKTRSILDGLAAFAQRALYCCYALNQLTRNSLFVDFHDRCYCFTDAAACRHVEPGNFYRADLHPAPVVHNSRISVNTLRMIDDPPTVGMIISTKIAAFHDNDIPDSEWPQRVAWLHSTGNHFLLKTLQNSAPFESLRLGVEFQCEIVKVGYYDNASKGFLDYELKPVTPPAGAPHSGLADLGGTGIRWPFSRRPA